MTPQAKIRDTLRARRLEMGLTQRDVARLIGKGRIDFHRIETGERRIKPATMIALCQALGLTIEDLVGDATLAESIARAAEILS